MNSAAAKEEAGPNDDDVGGAAAVAPDLPSSIISDILRRLMVEDLARCKAVAKSWYELSKDPHFTHLHYFTTSSQDTTNNNVLLWNANDYHALSFVLVSNKNGKWKSVTLSPEAEPDLANSGVSGQASCNGLLCLTTRSVYAEGPNLVYNPLTREAITLPQLNSHPDYEKMFGCTSALGFDPINNKYKLVLAYNMKCDLNHTWRMTAAILTLGEALWRTLKFPSNLETVILNQEPLFFKGAFHWVFGERLSFEDQTCLDGILLLDITTENFQIINFSPSVAIPYENLEQLQIENSLAFASIKDNNHTSFDIWQIHGANTDGTCLYMHRTFNLQGEGCPLIDTGRFKLLGAFNNGVFLFKAYQTGIMGELLHNHLVLYDTRKDQGSVIEISGVPKYFNARIFSPSFISPTL